LCVNTDDDDDDDPLNRFLANQNPKYAAHAPIMHNTSTATTFPIEESVELVNFKSVSTEPATGASVGLFIESSPPSPSKAPPEGGTVGEYVGKLVCLTVGVHVGFLDGVKEGFSVGAFVGFLDGLKEGDAVGFTDGEAVGFMVGISEGRNVGAATGIIVGNPGKGVGTAVLG
jgi:hypothetical protein